MHKVVDFSIVLGDLLRDGLDVEAGRQVLVVLGALGLLGHLRGVRERQVERVDLVKLHFGSVRQKLVLAIPLGRVELLQEARQHNRPSPWTAQAQGSRFSLGDQCTEKMCK